MEASFVKEKDAPWKVLEFYSGIGGLRYSLMKAGVAATVVEAFDINDCANDVYQHNFGHRPYQGNIGSLTAADLDKYGAHAWLLSPPCQPYTRQGLQKGSDDARASSFLKILDLIPETKKPPFMIFVENVVGFEKSLTREHLIRTLENTGFVTQEYILSPLQFGVPYSRPRYFCVAKRYPLSFANPCLNKQLVETNNHFLICEGDAWVEPKVHKSPCRPIRQFLETIKSISRDTGEGYGIISKSRNATDGSQFEGVADDINPSFLADNNMETCYSTSEGTVEQYSVPLTLIEKFGSSMDIVYAESRRCCCFTKSYYRYVKGTGSLLSTVQDYPLEEKPASLHELGLRYFTPREVANFHSFPAEFEFPQNVTIRQRYALLGNSLSIAVVAPLLRYLFTESLLAT